jgi:GABA permease
VHNPLRSEEEAFRWVVVILVGALAIIALTALTRPLYGALLLALLVLVGIAVVWRGSRGSERQRTHIERPAGDRRRILVIANQTVGGKPLLEQIRTKARNGEAEVLVVTPALTSSKLSHWASDVDEAIEGAKDRLERSLEILRSEGFEARGEVGDSEPNQAISDALLKFGADELIISTLPPGVSHWLEKDVVERARQECDVPVTHVIVDLQAEKA